MCESKDQTFVVKFYSDDENPSIKGNGFDGLIVGEEREEAEEFVSWVNSRLRLLWMKTAMVSELELDIARKDKCIADLEASISRCPEANNEQTRANDDVSPKL